MFIRRSKEKELKMIWELDKNSKRSLLIGTAHFFPYSFKTSLTNCLQSARTAIFEGNDNPLSLLFLSEFKLTTALRLDAMLEAGSNDGAPDFGVTIGLRYRM